MQNYLPLDIANSSNWNFRYYRSESAPTSIEGSAAYIDTVSVAMNHHIVAIGCRSNMAKPNWWLGLDASMRVFSPALGNQFPPLIEVQSTRCPLNRLTLVMHPLIYPLPYWLYLTPPKWIKQIYFEIWEYTGEITTDNAELLLPALQQSLSRIETKIDNL